LLLTWYFIRDAQVVANDVGIENLELCVRMSLPVSQIIFQILPQKRSFFKFQD